MCFVGLVGDGWVQSEMLVTRCAVKREDVTVVPFQICNGAVDLEHAHPLS